VLLPLEALIENPDEDEVGYLAIYADAWRSFGLDLPADLIYEILDAEQLVWDQAARPEPEAVEILAWLATRGIKRAICSNAPFPAEMMLRQVRTNGLAGMVDAVIFSSQIGRRKPAPEAYRAALEAVGASADSALFVGDRVREDYEGPRSLGMRAVICTAHAAEPPPHGTATIVSLRELRGSMVARGGDFPGCWPESSSRSLCSASRSQSPAVQTFGGGWRPCSWWCLSRVRSWLP